MGIARETDAASRSARASRRWKSGSRWRGRCRGWRPSTAACAGARWGRQVWPAQDSWIEPRLGPGTAGRLAAEFDTVVQPERAVVPELELGRRDAPAAPAGRTGHLADHVLCRNQRDRLLERKAAFQGLRLLTGPGADLGLFGPG